MDVSKRLEVRETVRMMRRNKIPNVTILINNAAILYQSPFLEHNYEEIEKTFAVNVLSHFWVRAIYFFYEKSYFRHKVDYLSKGDFHL